MTLFTQKGHGGITAELAADGFVDAVEVGRGGAGIVYRCYQTSLARSVAVKVMATDLTKIAGNVFCVRVTRWAGLPATRTS